MNLLIGWFVGFYDISSFIGYRMPNFLSLSLSLSLYIYIYIYLIERCKPHIISYFLFHYYFLPNLGPSSGEDVLQKGCKFWMYITTL